jgi:hypothetical protein
MRQASVLIVVFVAVFVAASASAATRVWTGAVGPNWSSFANWSPQGPLLNGDDLEFPPWGLNRETVNDLTGLSVGKLAFANVYSISGNRLAVAGSILYDFGARNIVINTDITLAGPTLVYLPNAVFNGEIDVNGQTLTLHQQSPSLVLNGPIVGSGTINIVRSVEISGSGTFNGTINVTGGILWMTGSLPDATVNVEVGLGGNGEVGPVTVVTGWISPMHTKSLTMAGTYNLGLSPNGQFDVLQVTGSVTLRGSLRVPLLSGSSFVGQVFTIIDNDGTDPVDGTFVDLPEGATIERPPHRLRISYAGGDGNDVTLTSTTPSSTTVLTAEPGTFYTGQSQPGPVTLIATVTSTAGVPTGTVTFTRYSYDGLEAYAPHPLGTVPLQDGVAKLDVPTIAVNGDPNCGNGIVFHYYTATYSGSETIVASSDQRAFFTTARPTRTTVTSSQSVAAPGDAVTFIADVSITAPSSAAASGPVVFQIDGEDVATVELQDGQATYTTTELSLGSHTITAAFSGDRCKSGIDDSKATITQVIARNPPRRRAVK